jgi:hypothetical protein
MNGNSDHAESVKAIASFLLQRVKNLLRNVILDLLDRVNGIGSTSFAWRRSPGIVGIECLAAVGTGRAVDGH